MKKMIVRYTRRDFDSEWSTDCHMVDVKSVPNRDGRNGMDFDEWLKTFPKVKEPESAPEIEERGNGWVAHIIETWEN